MDLTATFLGCLRDLGHLLARRWPVTIPLLAAAVWSCYRLALTNRLMATPSFALLTCSGAVLVGVPLCVTAYWIDLEPKYHSELEIMALGYLAVAVVAIIAAKGYRVPLSAFGAFALWVNGTALWYSLVATTTGYF